MLSSLFLRPDAPSCDDWMPMWPELSPRDVKVAISWVRKTKPVDPSKAAEDEGDDYFQYIVFLDANLEVDYRYGEKNWGFDARQKAFGMVLAQIRNIERRSWKNLDSNLYGLGTSQLRRDVGLILGEALVRSMEEDDKNAWVFLKNAQERYEGAVKLAAKQMRQRACIGWLFVLVALFQYGAWKSSFSTESIASSFALATLLGGVGALVIRIVRGSREEMDNSHGFMAHLGDAGMRMLVGAFSAMLLNVCLKAHVFSIGQVADSKLPDPTNWLLIFAFLAAGSSERFLHSAMAKVPWQAVEAEESSDSSKL